MKKALVVLLLSMVAALFVLTGCESASPKEASDTKAIIVCGRYEHYCVDVKNWERTARNWITIETTDGRIFEISGYNVLIINGQGPSVSQEEQTP